MLESLRSGPQKFRKRELRNARDIVLSFAGRDSSDSHLGTVGFLGLEIAKRLPDKRLRTTSKPTESFGATAYRHAYIIFEAVVKSHEVTDAIEKGAIDSHTVKILRSEIQKQYDKKNPPNSDLWM